MSAETKKRGNPKRKIGIVLKNSMNKTIVVGITRLVKHKLYNKYIKRTKKCYVHDENNVAQCGDKVRIIETKPLSKLKRWRLVEVLAQ
ncbi:MAG: 30S ribosomal protein S17 [Candidatus Omnitrophica bacterium]|nr:30S ribosomal protein S17 [Candidatus Omnitrophota bacterium]